MAHYQPNVCQVPATRCWGKKISLGGAFSLSLAGAFDVKDGTPGRQRNDKAKLTMTTDNSRLINVRGNEKKMFFPIL